MRAEHDYFKGSDEILCKSLRLADPYGWSALADDFRTWTEQSAMGRETRLKPSDARDSCRRHSRHHYRENLAGLPQRFGPADRILPFSRGAFRNTLLLRGIAVAGNCACVPRRCRSPKLHAANLSTRCNIVTFDQLKLRDFVSWLGNVADWKGVPPG